MKLFRILFSIFLLIWLIPVSASSLNPNPSPRPVTSPPSNPIPAPVPAPKPTISQEDIFKLAAVITGCEMSEQCIITMLNELSKTDPNVAYKEYLRQVEMKKMLVENNIKMCNTDQIQIYKKTISQCVADGMTTIEKASGTVLELNNMIEKQIDECLTINMHTLATGGNLYAQMTLAQKALESSDTKTYQYWYTMVREQVKSVPELTAVQNCAGGLDFPLKALYETSRALSGLPNK